MGKNKKLFSAFLAVSAIVIFTPSAFAASAKPIPTIEWTWLREQAASGAEKITLNGNVRREADEPGLAAEGSLTIVGNGFTVTGALVAGGTVIFQDVTLAGAHGIGEEDGGAALTLSGEGTLAVLSGTTRAVGGRSGLSGERGGDGVLLSGDGQGVLLRNRAYAQGGAGHILGGNGILAAGCANGILMTDSAAAMGGIGLANGGSGVDAPECANVQVNVGSAVVGGSSVYTGGNGVHSPVCALCSRRQSVAIGGDAMITSGLGETGGNAVWMERDAPGLSSDLALSDHCTLIGGAGGTAGSALAAANSSLSFRGSPTLYGGDYFTTSAPALDLTGCETDGDPDAVTQAVGTHVEKYPASDMSAILNRELSQFSGRHTLVLVENGLTTRKLVTRLNGLTVGQGRVSRVTLGGGLRMNLWNASLEKRLDFIQRLYDDGGDISLVLIASSSEEWLTLEATVASLRKLVSIGVKQLAYTSVDPVYCERIVDIAALLKAAEAEEPLVARVFLGTADDCVIFEYESGERKYQEELMRDVRRYLAD